MLRLFGFSDGESLRSARHMLDDRPEGNILECANALKAIKRTFVTAFATLHNRLA